jgi:DNA-binding transcriptional MerR regulator
MTDQYRIGELAKRTGRGIHAIRWYEAQGLIPGVIRDAGGRRVYNERHQSWLELMERLRRTGMSIAEMRKYTSLVKQGRGTMKQRQELLALHRSRIQEAIADWTAALQFVDSKIDYYGEWLMTGQRPRVDASHPLFAAKAQIVKSVRSPHRVLKGARAK